MRRAHWLAPDTRERVARAVARVEAQTSAEIVVAVDFTPQAYRDVGHLLGALTGLAFLVAYVYAPFPFYDDLLLVEVAALFGAVSLLAPRSGWLVRHATTRARRRTAAESRAKISFVDNAVSSTRARTGVLVHIAMLEREIVVLADIGIARADIPEWDTTITALRAALVAPAPIDRVVELLEALGEALAKVHPTAPDDINELPDGMVLA